MIRHATLGFAIAEFDNDVHEEGGNNRGPRIDEYLENVGIDFAAPWCAAAIQYCSDIVCNVLGETNPLDAVKLEAYVQSYHDWAAEGGLFVSADDAAPGDLVLYSFGGERYDHIGILAGYVNPDRSFPALEGNTGSISERDGDGFFRKVRQTTTGKKPVLFVRWAA